MRTAGQVLDAWCVESCAGVALLSIYPAAFGPQTARTAAFFAVDLGSDRCTCVNALRKSMLYRVCVKYRDYNKDASIRPREKVPLVTANAPAHVQELALTLVEHLQRKCGPGERLTGPKVFKIVKELLGHLWGGALLQEERKAHYDELRLSPFV